MMGTELVRPCIKEENMEIPSIPPGFEAFTTFSLKKVEDTEMVASCSTSTSAFGSRIVKVEPVFTSVDEATITRSLRRKPWVNYDRCDDRSGNESDGEQNLSLPKGVVRGCAECNDCQKVTARWHPEDACRPNLEEVPVFYPTEQEFEDTIQYIASIRSKAEKYGICRIVPPPSWKPPCPLKDKYKWERSKFPTRVQRVDKLQNRDSANKMLKANNKRRKRRRCMKSGLDCGTGAADCFASGAGGAYPVDNFGFEPGPEFTLDSFQKYAHDFKAQYFRNIASVSEPGGIEMTEQSQPTVEDIEGEYWRMVEKPTEEIEVLYGADLETGLFGSGFPKLSHQSGSPPDEKYVKSGWNLNNFPRLPGSVLSYESSDISGVLVPWLYVGMCFSSFCWHVEDHHLYSLNYMHWGAPKMWYGVPGEDAPKLEAAMRKHLPDLFKDQPDLLHKLVTQLSPSILKAEGVPVYRCVQNAGEFVLTFPRAYHSGFNCGFNCAEAVNVAPVDWLPHGQTAIELYREQGRKTSISHDKLLLGAARDAVRAHWELNLLRKNTSNNLRWKNVCGKDGVLSKTLKTRVEMERVRREFLCHSSRAVKMESNFDATDERECSVCLFDLHLSATGCSCSPDKYACLNHANQLCSCSWSAKYFLFRYEISELIVLVEALEGKLSAVYRWARLDLGLALSSHVSKENKQVRELVANPPHYSSEPAVREISSHTSIISHKATEGKKSYFEDIPNSSGSTDGASSNEKFVPTQVVLALEAVKASSALPKSLNEVKQSNSCSPVKKKEEASRLVLKIKTPPICQLSQEDTSFVYSPEEKVEEKKPLSLGNSDIILLSDDEGEESKPPTLETSTSEKQLKISQQTMDSVTVATSNCAEDPLSCKPLNNAAAMCEEVLKASSDEMNSSSTSKYMKAGVHEKDEILLGSTSLNVSSPAASPDPVSTKNGEDKSNDSVTGDCSLKIVERCAQPPQSRCSEIPNNEDNQKLGLNGIMRLADDARSALEASSSGQNNLDKYYRQKGPRMAKVVRRINCNVEPLEYGAVQSGKFWCDSRAIFPKGFKSRVRYINVLDPTNLCHYVSEILDAGHDRPLFMVSVEQCPNEVFIHLSAAKCWEMVRDRVNQEINKQHKLGRIKLPPLQPPGSLDGMEMFGFSSPEIVQGIQALDRNQVSTEYWKSRPLMQQSGNIISSTTTTTRNNADDKEEAGKNCTSADNTVLAGLFKKANPEELHVLHKMLLNDRNPSTTNQQQQDLVIRLLDQEIRKLVR